MIDFRKHLSKERYAFVKSQMPEMFQDIVAFSSTFRGKDLAGEGLDLAARAAVEDYCMGVACRAYRQGENYIRDMVR